MSAAANIMHRRPLLLLSASVLGVSCVTLGTSTVVALVMAVQPYISAIVGLVIVAYILHRLFCCSSQYRPVERLGMGMTAAGMVMATPALWMPSTPFDGWSFNVARIGIAIYVITGGLRRDQHRARNLAQASYAEGYRDGKSGRKPGA